MEQRIVKKAEEVAKMVKKMRELAQSGKQEEAKSVQTKIFEIRTGLKINDGVDLKEFDELSKQMFTKF